MTSQDIGNYHFGRVAAATGIFSQDFSLKMAGWAQRRAGTSNVDWNVFSTSEIRTPSSIGTYTFCKRKRLPPYGDDPNDQKWISKGYQSIFK